MAIIASLFAALFGRVLWAGPTHGTYHARLLQAKLVGDETPVVQAESGHVLDLGNGARL